MYNLNKLVSSAFVLLLPLSCCTMDAEPPMGIAKLQARLFVPRS